MKVQVLLILFVFQFNISYSNIASMPRPSSGHVIGSSPMKNIKVLHEILKIDFRGIVNNQRFSCCNGNEGFFSSDGLVRVDASYKINCLSDISNLDLVFVANNLTESRYLVKVDGKFKNGYLTPLNKIPSSWLPPDSIKWRSSKIPYLYSNEGLISFRIDSLPKGEHLLEVSYDACASSWFNNDDIGQCKELVYILRPSNEWNYFGSFDLKIYVPNKWEISSNLELSNYDDEFYYQYFESLPSDYLSIVVKKPVLLANFVSVLFIFISAVLLLLLIYWCLRL